MELVRRIFYFFYYLKETDFSQLMSFIKYSASKTGRSKIRITADVVGCVLKYNISLKDYFCFRFFELSNDARKEWAGTGFMYQYQLRMNPRGDREVLDDKIRFFYHFKPYIKRAFYSLNELKADQRKAEQMLGNPSGLLVLKGSHGQIGAEVEVIHCHEYTSTSLLNHMKTKNYDLIEEYVFQHPELMALSPSGLNTVRIFTQLHEGIVDFLGARLRVSVNSTVDNMAAGNLAAPIDIDSGVVTGPGVFSDITKEDQLIHPVTGKPIKGFVIPFWEEVLALARNAALNTPKNKSVGWDIAVTGTGPELIEGNHNWCKLLWQLPVKRGLKRELEKYL